MTAAFDILPGEPNAIATATSPMSSVSTIGGGLGIGLGGAFIPGEIVGMDAASHQIASAMSANLQHADGSADCVDDVPKWDFHWQLDYMFTKGVPYGPNDELTVTCEYDNTAAHQPVINGVQQQPHEVTWGEGSLDEMCLHYIWLRFERDAFLAAR